VTPWRCYAKPAALDGRTCGFENTNGGMQHKRAGGSVLICCDGCGATKTASDDRRLRAERAIRVDKRTTNR
jgi:hypothetical protein